MKKTIFISLLLLSCVTFAQKKSFKNLIEKDGKIGIGTQNPDALLTVKGDVHAQEVRVDLQGALAPDYVFEYFFENYSYTNPNYVLLSLEELEAFIETNHHLPKIPSAVKMENEGFSLKEMNLLLLEKIEELTLYAIQQQKEIDELKEIVNDLKN